MDSTAHNLGTTPVNTLEALNVARSLLLLLLELRRVDHHGNGTLRIGFRKGVGVGQATNASLGVIETTLTNEPPG